jgi:hypothetical protein
MASKKQKERQRANRLERHFEEKLDSKNCYGNSDPTPLKAVKNIIRQNKGGNTHA